jgi:very-short-patch-repair endonuclease
VRRDLVDLDAVEAMLRRHPRRRGCGKLRAILDTAAGPALTRSEAEARFLALLRKAAVPRPRTNAVVSGLEVDFFWPDRGVVVEVDGFAFHSHRGAFEDDRQRDALLAGEDLTVLRFTWRQVVNESEKVVARLCMALGARIDRRGD